MKIGEVKQHFNTCSVGQTLIRGIDADVLAKLQLLISFSKDQVSGSTASCRTFRVHQTQHAASLQDGR
jgi:hypothetical protein